MNWTKLLSLLFPIALELLGKLIPAVGGALGGPLGWILSFALNFAVKALAEVAQKWAIDADVQNRLNELQSKSQVFFDIEDRRARGEIIDLQAREKAIQEWKDAAKKLIKRKKPQE